MSGFTNLINTITGKNRVQNTQSTKATSTTQKAKTTQVNIGAQTPDTRDVDVKINISDLSSSGMSKITNKKHTIKSGDTFSKLAKEYGVTTQAMLDANPGVEPTKLRIGQQINIPASGTQAKQNAAEAEAKAIADVKQKAITAKTAFQNSPSGSKEEIELQKKFLNEYINWAKTVLSSKHASKTDIQDVITQITALKTYKAADIKPLQAELNSLLPALKEKGGVPTSEAKADTTAKTTTTQKTTTPPTPAKTQSAQTSKTHKIVAGDTYWKIANDNGITVAELKAANPKVDPAALRVGQTITVPAPKPKVIHSDMDVDASKRSEYKSQIEKMMKAKGITDKDTIEKLSKLITDKSIEMKVDPIVISGIVGQECDYLYQSDNIWGRNGKGMTQLTYSAIEDLYRLKGEDNNYVPAYYKSTAKAKLTEIFKKYPDVDSLYEAICKKENYELNLEVGIIVFKGKIEIDYSTHPERTDREHLEHSIRNYNGNTAKLKSGVEVRDQYRTNIVANYDKYKVS